MSRTNVQIVYAPIRRASRGGGRLARVWCRLVRFVALLPARLALTFVAVVGLGFLPGAGIATAILGAVLVSTVLACGSMEGPFARVLGVARGLSPHQRAALKPTFELTEQVGLAPRRVLVRLTNTDALPATPLGHHTVVVQPWLVRGLEQNLLTTADTAAAIGHAVAQQRVSASDCALSLRLWTLPWAVFCVAIRTLARRSRSRVPGGEWAWRLRIALGIAAVYQGVRAGGDPGLGIVVGILFSLSYLAPAADRARRRAVESAADEMVARRGLADSLTLLVAWSGSTDAEQRVRRIRQAAASTDSADNREAASEPRTPRGNDPGRRSALAELAPTSSGPHPRWVLLPPGNAV